MKLSEILKERGYVYQHSSEKLEDITDGPKRTLYLGVDPSADSLQVGQLMGFLILRRFLEDGHKVILVIGGGTGLIGDPGGKNAERPLLDREIVNANAGKIEEQAKKLFGDANFMLINNAEWLLPLNLLEFLRDVGKHFTVNAMLQRDFIKDRIKNPEESISYTEFSYALLQAYDFAHLHKEYACDLQVGGSDQWGNIVSGVDYIRRATGDTVYALTWPLLLDKAGKKFGKSEKGTVWLGSEKTTPFNLYQFWLNTEDDLVKEYLLKMTLVRVAEIDAVMELQKRDAKERHAQKLLAREVTALVHGKDEAERAETISATLFGDIPLASLSTEALTVLRNSAPMCEVKEGALLVEVLVSAKLASSKREAREFLSKKAVELNGVPVVDAAGLLAASDFHEGYALLRCGKRNVCVLIQT